MLIITRRAGERIMIGDDVVIEILEVAGNSVRVGIEAPRSVPVYRNEIYVAARDGERSRRVPPGAGRVRSEQELSSENEGA